GSPSRTARRPHRTRPPPPPRPPRLPGRTATAVGDRRRRDPRAHWGLLAISLAVVLVLVAVQGLSTKTIGASRTPVGHPTAAAPLAGRPAVLAGHDLTGRRPPRRTIALTFDDGPDPRWTPRVAAVLRHAHVPASFFVVGANVARNAKLVAALHRDGFE